MKNQAANEKEKATARVLEDLMIYLELFESVNSPEVNSLRLTKCIPAMFRSQLELCEKGAVDSVGSRTFSELKWDSFDALMEKRALFTSNIVMGPERDSDAFEVGAIRELWGPTLQRERNRINASLPSDCRHLGERNRLAKVWLIPIRKDGGTGMIRQSTWNYIHKDWHVTDLATEQNHKLNQIFVTCLNIGLVAREALSRSWAVEISYPKARASVSLLTDPTGVKEWFRLRDVPEDKSRRDALLHWVESHWRQNRVDPEIETYVRKYIRGHQEFRWFNMNAAIKVPESDEEKLDILKHERRVMAILGRDKRPRESS